MNIIKTIPASLSNKTLYDLTMSPKTRKMSEAKGSVLELKAVALYEDTDRNGEIREVLSIQTPDGECFATNSSTFQEDFKKMLEVFGDDGIPAIEVISGRSKAGREFLTCSYAGE